MINIKPYHHKIQKLCKELKVAKLSLFGSALTPNFTGHSDVDVIVAFDGSQNLFLRYMNLKDGLEKVFKRKVDVVMAKAIRNPYFKKSISKNTKLLYAA